MIKNNKDFGEGIRRLYKDALDDKRMLYPRYKETRNSKDAVIPSKLRHSIQWYLDGHLTSRPVYGVYAMGVLAEHLLHQVKFGKRDRKYALVPVMEFFAETRRAMRDMLTCCSIKMRLPKSEVSRMRLRVATLIKSAEIAIDAMKSSKKNCKCPACSGNEMSSYDRELLSAILYERSQAGVIPVESSLYRKFLVDMEPHEMI